MAEKLDITQRIDALVVAPVDDCQRHRAALVVCATMTRVGSSREQIRDVLAALALLPPTRTSTPTC